ncbi:hypothetical protein C8J56DRAFT_1030183 [Mycena floridula]|nr:hypothetical protein C8J56DRAFT_1030183 [Mycena floridula]
MGLEMKRKAKISWFSGQTSEGRNSTRTGLRVNVANSPAFWGCISINAMRVIAVGISGIESSFENGREGKENITLTCIQRRLAAPSLLSQFSCPLDQVFDDQYSRALTVLRASEFDGFIHLGLPRQGIPNNITARSANGQSSGRGGQADVFLLNQDRAFVKSRQRLLSNRDLIETKASLKRRTGQEQAVEEAYSGDRIISARMSNHLYPDFHHHSLEEIIGAEEIRGFISKTKEKTDGDDGGIRRRSRVVRALVAWLTPEQDVRLDGVSWVERRVLTSRLWLSTRSSAYDRPKPPPSLKDFQAGDTASLLKECAKAIWDRSRRSMKIRPTGPVPVLSEVGDIKSMDARRHGLTPSKAVLTVHRGGFGKWPPRSISRLVLESGILMCPAVVPIFPISVVLVLFSSERVQDQNLSKL